MTLQEPHHSPNDERDTARLERLREDIARLPRDITPSRDAWPDIRRRIEAQRIRPIRIAAPSRKRWLSPWWLGVAATVIATAGTMITVAQRARSFEASGTAEPSVVTPIALNLATDNPRLAAVLAEYQQATRELEAEISARTAGLPPSTRGVVRQSLATIDVAIADLRSALVANPRDAAAAQSLPLVYERKLEFLKRVRSIPGIGM